MFVSVPELELTVAPPAPGREEAGPALRVDGRRLHSGRDPLGEAARWARATAEELAPAPHDVIVLFGAGWGWPAVAMSKEFSGRIFVHEPIEALRLGAPSEFPRPWGSARAPYLALDEPSDEVVLGLGLKDDTTVHVVAPPVYARMYPEGKAELEKRLARLANEACLYRETARTRAAEWADNNFANAESIASAYGVSRLDGVAKGKPIFIVAAGPSLDKNVHLLAEARRRGFVLAVNHSLKALHRAGIHPHLVPTLEGRNVASHFDVPPALFERQVFGTMAHPDLFGLPHRVRWVAHIEEEPVAKRIVEAVGENGLAVSGGSVATMAFALAMRMGGDPIVLVGQDLAFTGGRGYAAGVSRGDMRVEKGPDGTARMVYAADEFDRAHPDHKGETEVTIYQSGHLVEGWDGEPVLTSRSLDAQRSWFERAIHGNDRGARIINATEGGARIQGADCRRLEDVLSELPEVEGLDALLDLPKPDAGERLLALRRFATSRRRKLQGAVQLLDDGLRKLEPLLATPGEPDERQLNQFGRVDATLGQYMRDVPEVDSYLAAHEPSTSPVDDDGADLEATAGLYGRMRTATTTVLERFDELEQRLRAGDDEAQEEKAAQRRARKAQRKKKGKKARRR